jgi:uncharacterized membrane-anchored protein
MNKTLLIFLVVLPSIINAAITDDNPYDMSPFDEVIKLTNGSLYPNSYEASKFGDEGGCNMVKEHWGWTDLNCNAMDKLLIATGPNIDTLVIETPRNIGYVEYDDWYADNKEKDIDEIVKLIKQQYIEQSQRVNRELKFLRWIVYPTLVEDKNYMYYAYLSSDDGHINPIIESMIYDRNGYIKFQIVPRNLTESSSESEYRTTVESALNLYTPDSGLRYADFTKGDKVYQYGVIGSLAALAGVSWKGKGKAAAAGIFGMILIFAKKLWWLIFIPIIALFKRLFGKKE